tara:strand:+ start:9916 stop:10881 length:966 start_codon:yes stop_codon:yes gene_type:complete
LKHKLSIKEIAIETLNLEAKSIKKLIHSIDSDFEKIINLIHKNKGKLIITGIGKSAIIGKKIVATLNSTGTPSFFLHAADAMHGDIGIIQKDDIIMCMSKSGDSPEIKMLIPIIKKRKNKIIGLTSKLDSFLAKNSDFVIYTYVKKEACPNNLAPTTSTSVQLAIGDAIAMSLLSLNNINTKDFAELHPGGQIGKSLTMTLGEIIHENEKPIVNNTDKIQTIINEISTKRLGATIVMKKNKIAGIITDGDIRRMLQKFDKIKNISAEKIMTKDPIKKENDFLASKARKLMSKKKINHIVVVDKKKSYLGIVHILDLIKEGF